jgi:hypothetical protein
MEGSPISVFRPPLQEYSAPAKGILSVDCCPAPGARPGVSRPAAWPKARLGRAGGGGGLPTAALVCAWQVHDVQSQEMEATGKLSEFKSPLLMWAFIASLIPVLGLVAGLILDQAPDYSARAFSCWVGTLLACSASAYVTSYARGRCRGFSARMPRLLMAAFVVNLCCSALTFAACFWNLFRGLAGL